MSKELTKAAAQLIDDKFSEFSLGAGKRSLEIIFRAGVLAGLDVASMLNASDKQPETPDEKTD